jgi:hypothetical protein
LWRSRRSLAAAAATAVRGALLARTRERCGSRDFAPGLSLIVGRSDMAG